MKKTIDFTKGNLVKGIVLFALPILFSELLQNLYNNVDALVVGNFVGSDSLAAVSVSAPITKLIVGFFTGLSTGVTAHLSQLFGSGRDMHRQMNTVASFSLLLGILLSVVGFIVTPLLLSLVSPPHAVYAQARFYLFVYMSGLAFTVFYNNCSGILRAFGDARGALIIVAITSVMNIVLDLVFVCVLGLGVAGVAIATVLSQAVSAVAVFFRVRAHDPRFRISVKGLIGEVGFILSLLKTGLPAGLQHSLVSFSNIFVWRYISAFGTAAMAGIGTAQRLDHFVSMPAKAFGITATTMVGQNVGARQEKRARRGIRVSLLLSVASVLCMGVVIYSFSEFFVGLFNNDPEVIATGVAMMRFIIPFYFIVAVRHNLIGMLRGYRDTFVPMLLSLTGMVGARQLFLYFSMARDHNVGNIFACYPVAWTVTTVLILVYYLIKKNTRKRGKQKQMFGI